MVIKEDNMELQDLVGTHYLSGVDFGGKADYSNYIAFTLDGITYIATEDENDGYRSCMEGIEVTTQKISNIFNPVKVLCKMSDERDTLEVIDFYNGKLVIEVGTDYSESYYPSFIDYYQPENMSVNNIDDRPYIEEKVVTVIKKYNPNYGDDKICTCGHEYCRHFDSYDNMEPIGCKYCFCDTFTPKKLTHEEFVMQSIPVLGDIYRTSTDENSRTAAWQLLGMIGQIAKN